jgi:urease accessory protein
MISALQRARGRLRVEMRARDGVTVLSDLFQEGALKARFPRSAGWTEIVTLNSSGGIAGGDRLESDIVVQSGASATFAAQAAERFYRALPDDPAAKVRTRITVEAGAAMEWLPQESILFDRCALDRVLDIEVAADAWFLGVESLVFGRAAMGESVRHARLRDAIRVRRAGKLIFNDAIRIDGEVMARLESPAVAAGGHAVATMVLVADDAAAQLDGLRAAMETAPAEFGASVWNGMLVARIVAADGARLRQAVMMALQALRNGRPLPRVWMC